MPIYEYQCEQCDYHFDKLQKIKDQALRKCPQCGADALKKLVSAPRFKLTGSGWYETDFKDNTAKTTKQKNDDSKSKPTEPRNKTTDNTKQEKVTS